MGAYAPIGVKLIMPRCRRSDSPPLGLPRHRIGASHTHTLRYSRLTSPPAPPLRTPIRNPHPIPPDTAPQSMILRLRNHFINMGARQQKLDQQRTRNMVAVNCHQVVNMFEILSTQGSNGRACLLRRGARDVGRGGKMGGNYFGANKVHSKA